MAGHLNLADILTKSMDKPEFIARRDLVTGSGRRNNTEIIIILSLRIGITIIIRITSKAE